MTKRKSQSFDWLLFGRSEVTRTPGILLPKQARYQLRYTPMIFKYYNLIL